MCFYMIEGKSYRIRIKGHRFGPCEDTLPKSALIQTELKVAMGNQSLRLYQP